MNILMLYPKFPEQSFYSSQRSDWDLLRRCGSVPPLGLMTVASYLPEDFQVRLIDRSIRTESKADWEWADVVFLSLMIAQRADYQECIRSARRYGKPVAVGGPYTHAFPDAAVAEADWVCFGEAESIISDLVQDLRADRRARQYQGGNRTDVEQVKAPRFDILPDINQYAYVAIQFSRGCPFTCEFCDIIEIYGRVPRTKAPGQIVAELDALRQTGYRGHVFLSDDNFIGNKSRVKLMLPELAAWNRSHRYPFVFSTQASLNLADDPELLQAMVAAGVLTVFIGIETPDPELLKTTRKLQNARRDPLERLRRIRAAGLHISAGFILGFDGETREVFETQRAFIQASGVAPAMVGLLQALPHTQLSRRLTEEGRLLNTQASGITTTEGINFVPKGANTKRTYLTEYRKLVDDLYHPKKYFERSLRACLAFRAKAPLALYLQFGLHFGSVTLRELFHLGLKTSGLRWLFWKSLLQVVLRNPAALANFTFDCYFLHYLQGHAAYLQEQISEYLRAPHPGDVLDEVTPEPLLSIAAAGGRLARADS